MKKKLTIFLLHIFCMVLFLSILRLIFFAYFYDSVYKNSSESFGFYFWLGSKFDLKLTLIIFSPLLPVYFMSFFSLQITKKITLFYLGLASSILIFIYAFDFGHFSYLKLRISASILSFLQNPMISARMLSESYSFALYLPIILSSISLYIALSYFIQQVKIFPGNFSFKKNLTLSKVCISIFFVIGIYGQFSYYPLTWSQAFRTPNSELSHLALNPVLFLFTTLKFKPDSNTYDPNTIEKFLPKLNPLVGGYQITKDGHIRRILKSNFTHLKQKPNIIIVLLESLAAHKTSLFGNPLPSTPALDKLARSSLFYTKFYTASTSTARSVFASFVGIPDVSKVSKGTNSPFLVNQNILLNYMSSYEKFYFIGGNASWGNTRGMLKSSIDGLQLYEESDFSSPRNDVWGISDLDLFRESLSILKKKSSSSKLPFFAFIQTAGFHRPYTIPKNKGNFQIIAPSEKEIENGGFSSQKEFNSLRFQDYALSYFMENVKKKSFYSNTIFIIYGDHGLPVKDPQNLNKWQKHAVISQYHVPLLIHSPKFSKPRKIEHIAQQADIMPTVLDLAGYEAFTRTYGSSLFAKKRKNFAYSYAWSLPQFISYIDEKYYIQKLEKSDGVLNLYRSNHPEKNHVKSLKGVYQKLSLRLHALYEINKYLMHNNSRM